MKSETNALRSGVKLEFQETQVPSGASVSGRLEDPVQQLSVESGAMQHAAPPPTGIIDHANHPDHAGHTEPPAYSRESVRRPGIVWVLLMLLIGGGALAGLFLLGWLPQEKNTAELNARAELVKNSIPRVSVVNPRRAALNNDLILPGEIQAMREATLFARTTGYVKKWYADIGDKVTAGQLLAEIDTPEIERQYDVAQTATVQARAVEVQARAMLEEAKAKQANAQASADLAHSTMERFVKLRDTNSVSEQEITERIAAEPIAQATLAASKAAVSAAQANIGVSQANIKAAEAEVRRIETLRAFQRVLAPFDGIVTRREVDSGTMVAAGGTSGAQLLFRLVNTDTVRVFVDVPQEYASAVREGEPAELLLRDAPVGSVTGTIARTSKSIDKAARTLRTEIHVPNPSGTLFDGMYVQVKLTVARKTAPLILPGSALVVNADGTQVAVARDGTVHYQRVIVAGDYGATFGVSDGLDEHDTVITNPSERLLEGGPIEIATPVEKPK
jgi:RND family efflux transporter MFP subunit